MASVKKPSPFITEIRNAIRVRHYSLRTEQTYIHWIKRFIYFHNMRHPRSMSSAEVNAFLTHLAVNRNVAPNTQNQALNALNFLYRHVLDQPLKDICAIRARKKQKLPVVLTQDEVRELLKHLHGIHWLATCLMYGSGLRLMECCRLRVMHLDFGHLAIRVIDGKGAKDRVVTLPDMLTDTLQRHLGAVKMFMTRILLTVTAMLLCPTHWPANIPMRVGTGLGNMFSPPPNVRSIPIPALHAAITSMRALFRMRLRMRYVRPALRNRPVATRCAIPSPHICWNAGWTYARCKSSWGTRMCVLHRYTRMSYSAGAWL